MADVYPESQGARDQWILSHRPGRHPIDPSKPYAYLIEHERTESGDLTAIATVFLTNRECPWRCLMCDLWRNTLEEPAPAGSIPAQIKFALNQLPCGLQLPTTEPTTSSKEAQLAPDPNNPHPQSQSHLQATATFQASVTAIKLYNSGSFFDPLAIPPGDHPAIAAELRPFERIIVESHPSLIGASVLRFRDRLRGKLEVAMGLETVHPEILPRLNKRMTLEQFARAADFLHTNDIALRVFILLKLPFLHDEAESLEWAKRSLDFAFECHATAAAVIPTRPGNGALDTLAAQGLFSPPHVATLEAAVDYGICLNQGRVFADLWDLEQFQSCTKCFQDRKNRLAKTNREQVLQPPITCSCASRTSTHDDDAC